MKPTAEQLKELYWRIWHYDCRMNQQMFASLLRSPGIGYQGLLEYAASMEKGTKVR